MRVENVESLHVKANVQIALFTNLPITVNALALFVVRISFLYVKRYSIPYL